MKPENALLLDAIEDNIAWCSTICGSHYSEERNSESAWVNLAASPLLYPNIITRRRNCQAEIVRLVKEIVAGCISFSSGTVTGLSNWFSKRAEQVFDLGIMHQLPEPLPADRSFSGWPKTMPRFKETVSGRSAHCVYG
jgi:hypothetical protein